MNLVGASERVVCAAWQQTSDASTDREGASYAVMDRSPRLGEVGSTTDVAVFSFRAGPSADATELPKFMLPVGGVRVIAIGRARASRLTTADPLGHPVTAGGKAKASALGKVADRGVVRREARARYSGRDRQSNALIPTVPSAIRYVAGVDGCRVGWVVVLLDLDAGRISARVTTDFRSVLALSEAPMVIAVDVPIGLLTDANRGGRQCEIDARGMLGRRAPSVFSAPTRAALAEYRINPDYQAVATANRGGVANAPGLSHQSFCILSKIDEVDAALAPEMQDRVREVHPELCFAEANGGSPMTYGKKTIAGRNERAALLCERGFDSPLTLLGARRPTGVGADDLLDACIA